MEVRPGRPDRNVARMLEMIERARSTGLELIAFPELCVPGYIIGDAWEADALVRDFAAWDEVLRAASVGITVVYGNVAFDPGQIGEDGRIRKFNAVHVCRDGAEVRRAGLPPGLPGGAHAKTLQPNYRFFDDDRHFYSLRKLAAAAGRPVSDWLIPYRVPRRSGGELRFGVQLCEDLWCEDYEQDGEVLDTLRVYRERGAEAVINLSSSPWTWQKSGKRHRTVREVLRRSPLPFFYVNQVGALNNGKNILVFDGDSTAYAPDASLVARAPAWRETLLVVDGGAGGAGDGPGAGVDAGRVPFADGGSDGGGGFGGGADGGHGANPGGGAPPHARRDGGAAPVPADTGTGVNAVAPAQSEMAAICDGLVVGLRHLDHVRGAANSFLVGVSGGVDSSVVACLLVRAFGPRRVFAVNMPTRFNSERTRDNARALCDALDVDYLVCPIDDLHTAFAERIRSAGFPGARGAYTGLVDENVQARIRGAGILAGLAAKLGLLFTNNGNKTEIALGYATLYGDVSGAVAPLGDLYKTQVFDLARYLNESVFAASVIPENLYDGSTVPSAELSADQDITKGQGDPIKYGYHDALLRQLIEYRRHPTDLMRWFAGGELSERIGWNDAERFSRWFADSAAWVADLEWLATQLRISVFKRIQAPPVIVLSKRAFGFDLRESQLPAYPLRACAALRREALSMPLEAGFGRGG